MRLYALYLYFITYYMYACRVFGLSLFFPFLLAYCMPLLLQVKLIYIYYVVIFFVHYCLVALHWAHSLSVSYRVFCRALIAHITRFNFLLYDFMSSCIGATPRNSIILICLPWLILNHFVVFL